MNKLKGVESLIVILACDGALSFTELLKRGIPHSSLSNYLKDRNYNKDLFVKKNKKWTLTKKGVKRSQEILLDSEQKKSSTRNISKSILDTFLSLLENNFTNIRKKPRELFDVENPDFIYKKLLFILQLIKDTILYNNTKENMLSGFVDDLYTLKGGILSILEGLDSIKGFYVNNTYNSFDMFLKIFKEINFNNYSKFRAGLPYNNWDCEKGLIKNIYIQLFTWYPDICPYCTLFKKSKTYLILKNLSKEDNNIYFKEYQVGVEKLDIPQYFRDYLISFALDIYTVPTISLKIEYTNSVINTFNLPKLFLRKTDDKYRINFYNALPKHIKQHTIFKKSLDNNEIITFNINNK